MKDKTNKSIRKQINNLYEKKTEAIHKYIAELEDIDVKLARIQDKCPHTKTKVNDFLYDHSVVCEICDKILEEHFGVFTKKE